MIMSIKSHLFLLFLIIGASSFSQNEYADSVLVSRQDLITFAKNNIERKQFAEENSFIHLQLKECKMNIRDYEIIDSNQRIIISNDSLTKLSLEFQIKTLSKSEKRKLFWKSATLSSLVAVLIEGIIIIFQTKKE